MLPIKGFVLQTKLGYLDSISKRIRVCVRGGGESKESTYDSYYGVYFKGIYYHHELKEFTVLVGKDLSLICCWNTMSMVETLWL